MTLDRVIDALAARLTAGLHQVRVDDVAPAAVTDLPCAVLALHDVRDEFGGIGRVARGTRTGALPLHASIDLATPVLDLGGGESLQLVSADRRTVTLPHGPIVRADGTDLPPLTAADVSANDGSPYDVVAAEPTGRQVKAEPDAGQLIFGSPLPATGQLNLTYHIGAWDSVTTRAEGLLTVQILAAGAPAVSATARAVAGLLSAADGGVRTVPASWDPVVPTELGDASIASQTLGFRLDAELEDPVLTTGGGIVARVAVTGGLQVPGSPTTDPVEPFDVTRSTA